MKPLMVLLGIGGLVGCSSFRWEPPESVMLEGFRVYEGQHCESSAMLNQLRRQRYDVTEAQIIGAGAALGFVLEGSAFPFLGGRSLAMRENFERVTGIIRQLGTQERYGDGWEKIYQLLREGTPVVLRVDMRYLPYLFGGKYGSKQMSFGWHMVCIAGIDAERRIAYVTDTSYTELQQIKLADLHRARFSDTDFLPPRGEFYWAEVAPPDHRFEWERIAIESLHVTMRAMTEARSEGETLAGLDGLSKLPAALAGLDERVPSYLLSPLLAFHYGCIETNGTGGSAFRKLYHGFLVETANATGNEFVAGAAQHLEPAVTAWRELALGMKALSGDRATLKRPDARRTALAALGERARRLYRVETDFYAYIEEGGE
jgi:hypothetical protein